MDAVRGRIVNAKVELAGAATTADAFDGDTSVFVEDAGDFAEDGGRAKLYDGSLVEYTTANMDTGELTIPAGIATDVPAGKLVRVFPVRSVMTADVELLGHDEPLVVLVPHHLRPFVREGARDAAVEQEECTVIFDGRGWLLFDVQGAARVRLSTDHASRDRVFRYTAEGVGPAGYRGVKLTGYSGTIQKAWVRVDTAPTAPAVYELRLSGTLIATMTIPAGEVTSSIEDIADVPFDEGDVFRVRTEDPADVGADIRVRVRVTLEND